MFWLYSIPYSFFTTILGPLGGILACVILLMGLLRCSFLLVLFLTRDWTRLASEQTEGLSVVLEKLSNLRDFFWKKA